MFTSGLWIALLDTCITSASVVFLQAGLIMGTGILIRAYVVSCIEQKWEGLT